MLYFSFFFFNDTATTEIYTLSLHDALPIFRPRLEQARHVPRRGGVRDLAAPPGDQRDPGTPHDARHRTGTLLRCRECARRTAGPPHGPRPVARFPAGDRATARRRA